MKQTQTPPEVRAFVRADCQVGTEQSKEATLSKLDSLRDRGKVAGYDVTAWARHFRPAGPFEGTRYHDRVSSHLEQFRAWAAGNGATLAGGFDRRTLACDVVEESYDCVTLPVVCTAEFRNGRLVAVYPHRREGDCYTVSDHLTRLEETGERPPDRQFVPAGSPGESGGTYVRDGPNDREQTPTLYTR